MGLTNNSAPQARMGVALLGIMLVGARPAARPEFDVLFSGIAKAFLW